MRIIFLPYSRIIFPAPRPLRGAFAKRAKAGRTREKGPEMRPHQTFLLVPVKRSDPQSRPVRPPRVWLSLSRALGRFRGSARRALRPFCKELAGLGQGANAHDPGSAARNWRCGHAASRKCRGGAPKGERVAPDAHPSETMGTLQGSASRRSAPLTLRGGNEGKTPAAKI